MVERPNKFTIETMTRSPSGWIWAFVWVDGSCIAAGFDKDWNTAVADAIRTAERYGWSNPWHAPTEAERAST